MSCSCGAICLPRRASFKAQSRPKAHPVIGIYGVHEGQEYEAAQHLRRILLNWRPDLAQSRDDVVKIFVGFKLYGYDVEDLDLIVVGQLAEPRDFDVEWKFYPKDGEPFVPRLARV